MPISRPLAISAAAVVLMSALNSGAARAQVDPLPWETPSGRTCFDAWIRETTSIINAWDGSDQFNARKPWSMNEYGLFEGNPRIGPTSVAPPDNFPQYGNDRYWWMWVHYPVTASYQWPSAEWRNAGVAPLRSSVLACIAAAGGGAAAGETGTDDTIAADPTVSSVTPPPFGNPEPADVNGFAIQAGQRRVVAGETVSVPTWLINAADVSNMNFEIGYDVGVVAIEGDLVGGSLLGGRLFTANTAQSELLRVAFAGTSGLSGTGTVAWIRFRAVGDPGEFTTLTVTVTEVNRPDGTAPAIKRIAGWVQITDEEGRVPGDCNNDGLSTEYDAFCALQMSVGLRPVQPNLDQDADSAVTSRDATIILQNSVRRAS